VRNAFIMVGRDGTVLGRHDKDLPTMWENCFYVGGTDDGVIDGGAPGLRLGVAMCWELMRTQTVRRLRGRVDLVVGGSYWWSVPLSWPLGAHMEARNEATARRAAEAFPRYVGAPIVHASHAGTLACPMPWTPLRYRGHTEGSACIVDAHGAVLARRDHREGAGVVIADVQPGAVAPAAQPPDRFWLHRRGPVPALAWNQQRLHGRRWYRRHGRTGGGAGLAAAA
jgi:predicted amidohydrolase